MAIRDIQLRYGKEFRTLHIDEKNLLVVVEPRNAPAAEPGAIIAEALENPIGTLPLRQMVHPGDRVTILVDDNTRPTPVDLLLPPLLERLHAAGVAKQNITILIAGGTHRVMTEEEIHVKVGADVKKNYRVVPHRWMDKNALVRIGHTSTGVPVEVNRLVVEADFCVGIGDIAPHPLAGWSGGGKIVEPGVCGEATTGAVHILLSHFQAMSFVGNENCPIRLEIERIASKAGLKFIVNTVLDANRNIAKVLAGDPVKAHRAGVQFARKIWTASIPALADIVVASSYPADLDFWQAEKTLAFMECAIRRSGDMILLTPCPEGISEEPNHRQVILKYTHYPSKNVIAEAKAAGEWDMAGVNVAVHMAARNEFVDMTIVSDGITPAECEAMKISHATDVNEALKNAFKKHGPDAKVTVMTHGPKVVPIIEE